MSETVIYKGRLISTGKTFDEFMQEVEFPDYYDKNDPDDVIDYFYDLDNHVNINNIIYLAEKADVSYEDMFQAEIMPNGEISFLVRYYNGGCNFHEAIEEAVKRIKNDNKNCK